MTLRACLLLLFCCCTTLMAQNYSWEDFVEDYTSDMEAAEQDDWLLYLEELKQLHEQPLNINTATVDDLLQLPFLDEEIIEQIHAYIYLHGQMQTLGELRLIRGMSEQTYKWMHLFVVAEHVAKDEKVRPFSHLHSDLSSRLDIPLYYRKGNLVEDGYRGDGLYHRIRYELSNKRHFRAALRTEKDAGERYYDSYGGFAMLQDVGIIRKAIVGDYRIGFGEGLVMGGGIWTSKITPSQKAQGGIRPMTGMSETGFLRGAAVTIKAARQVDVSLFGSHLQQDATLNNDGEIKTLVTSGYHRTHSELNHKNNASTSLVGGNVTFQHAGLHLGASGYYQSFSRTLNPGEEAYRQIYPSGRQFGVAGLNYGYSRYRLSLAGETSLNTQHSAIATLHRASWAINRKYTLSAIQRFYNKNYYSFQANAFSENSNVQNESGVMLHLRAEPWAGWQLTTYVDFFHNPWPRYRMTHSSTGQEMMLQASFTPTSASTFTARYQLKRKETADVMEPHHRIKLQWTYTPSKLWKWQTSALLHSVLGSNGFGLQQTVRYTMPRPQFNFALSAAYFNTHDYDSRLYFYEPTLYSSIASGSFSGRGLHGALTARWTSKTSRWMLETKYSLTQYFDRNEQGTALQTIFSPSKNDISLQLRVRI